MIVRSINADKLEKYYSAYSSIEDTIRILIESSAGAEKSVWTGNSKLLFICAARALIEFISSKAYEKSLSFEKYQNIKINSSNLAKFKNEILNDIELDEVIRKEFLSLNIKNIVSLVNTTNQENFLKFCEVQNWNDYIGIFKSSEEQYGSFLMNFTAGIGTISALDFRDVVSTSDFNYNNFIDQPTIMFIDIPSTAETRKTIAALMVEQIFKYLSMRAKEYKGGALPRPFYFYLEELANIPRMECVKTILTLGRGMRIFAALIVQSVQQLEVMYGKEFLPICWDSTMARVYLLTQEKTRKF